MKFYYSKRHKGIFRYYQNGNKYGFRLTYYDDNHKRHEKSKRGFSNIRDAINTYNNVKTIKKNDNKELTIKAWCNYYLRIMKEDHKFTTYRNYKILLNSYVIPLIGSYKLKDITLDVYQKKCINKLISKKLARNTIKEVNARVQTAVNYAVVSGKIKHNPIEKIKIPRVNETHKKEIMNKEQLKQFHEVLNKHSLQYKIIFYTLEHTGMRAGELLGLHWKDINLNKRIIHIKYTRDAYGIRSPKTTTSDRKFAIQNALANLLKKYKHECISKFNVNNNSLVILGKRGKPLSYELIPLILKKLLVESGLTDLIGRFTPHSFRHLFASNLIEHGTSLIDVSRILGHSTPDTTLKFYAQGAPGKVPDLQRVAKKSKIELKF